MNGRTTDCKCATSVYVIIGIWIMRNKQGMNDNMVNVWNLCKEIVYSNIYYAFLETKYRRTRKRVYEKSLEIKVFI